MKRKKKAIVTKTTKTYSEYSVQCPHCKTQLEGNLISEYILSVLCYNCKQPIELVFK
jgi:hypothetical protein